MIIKEYGDPRLPKVLLLHPMLADGATMLGAVASMQGRYCFIAPDLSGQGADLAHDFVSTKQDTETLLRYLSEKDYRELALVMGASLGAQVGMYLIADGRIRVKTAVFDGTPMHEKAWLVCSLMTRGFLAKQRKAKKMPLERVAKVMEEMYGVCGAVMAKTLCDMSAASIRAIVHDCGYFDFPPIAPAMQAHIYLEVGSKDFNCRQNGVILRHYPQIHLKVRQGYGHCQYLSKHSAEYGILLEEYMHQSEGGEKQE